MRLWVLLVIVIVAAIVALVAIGALTFQRDGDEATIRIDEGQIRESTDRAVERGREVLDEWRSGDDEGSRTEPDAASQPRPEPEAREEAAPPVAPSPGR